MGPPSTSESKGPSMTDQIKKFVEWDGKIPAWGIILLGIGAVLYGWGWVNDIDRRLSRGEETFAAYRGTVDKLVLTETRLIKVEFQLSRFETVLDRIERKLDAQPTAGSPMPAGAGTPR